MILIIYNQYFHIIIKNFPNNNIYNPNYPYYNNNNNFYNGNNENRNINNIENYQKIDHLRGLVNIANTCYMNATLQCFAHIKELFAYFQKDHIKQLMKEFNVV